MSDNSSAVFQQELRIQTAGRGMYELSSQLCELVPGAGVQTGLCNIFILHTSASLMICENADPQVLEDLENFISRLVPDGDALFAHTAEGPDDMPAHVRSVLTQVELTLPVRDGQLVLGTWQGIYLWEHRARAHDRRLLVTIR